MVDISITYLICCLGIKIFNCHRMIKDCVIIIKIKEGKLHLCMVGETTPNHSCAIISLVINIGGLVTHKFFGRLNHSR